MLVLRVTMVEGRTAAQKAALIERLSAAAARHLGAPLEEVRLVIHEVPGANWGVGGRPLAGTGQGRESNGA